MALESVHELLARSAEVPLEDEHVSNGRRDNEVVHPVVKHHICDVISVSAWLHSFQVCVIILFYFFIFWVQGWNSSRAHSKNQVLKDDWRGDVLLSLLVLLELIEVCRLIGPANKEALLEVQSHAFDPFTDSLKAIVVIPDAMAFCFDHFDRDGVTFWV